jgi:hypothetical protein
MLFSNASARTSALSERTPRTWPSSVTSRGYSIWRPALAFLTARAAARSSAPARTSHLPHTAANDPTPSLGIRARRSWWPFEVANNWGAWLLRIWIRVSSRSC